MTYEIISFLLGSGVTSLVWWGIHVRQPRILIARRKSEDLAWLEAEILTFERKLRGIGRHVHNETQQLIDQLRKVI